MEDLTEEEKIFFKGFVCAFKMMNTNEKKEIVKVVKEKLEEFFIRWTKEGEK